MTTTLYLPASASSTINPPIDADWNDDSTLVRVHLLKDGIAGLDPMATVSFGDSDDTDKKIIVRQFVSLQQITEHQTIHGSQAIKVQIRGVLGATGSGVALTVGIRLMTFYGAIPKIILPVTRGLGSFASSLSGLTNFQFTATSAAGDYVCDGSEYLVVEMGGASDPILGDHDFSLRFGNDAASDLPEDNTETADLRPWIRFADDISFGNPDFVTGGGALFQTTESPHWDRKFVPVPY